MHNRIEFYGTQGIFNLRRSFGIIIGVGIALSMVGGLIFFSNSYQDQLITYKQQESADVIINCVSYESLDENLENRLTKIKTLPGLENLELAPFQANYFPKFYIVANYSELSGDIRPIDFDYVINPFNFNLYNFSFYQSPYCGTLFGLIQGNFPSQTDEIALDLAFAQAMNISVGDNVSFNVIGRKDDFTFYTNYALIPHFTYQFLTPELHVAGIFAMKHEKIDLQVTNFTSSYKYQEGVGTIYQENTAIYQTPILGFYNFTQSSELQPLIQFSDSISFFSPDRRQQVGYYGFFDLNSIDYNRLIDKLTVLENSFRVFQEDLPMGIALRESIVEDLTENYYLIRSLQYNLQYINIPLLGFAIIIGSFAIKSNIKGRLEEFLLLRSKGSPNSMIQFIITTESFFLGIVSAIVGILGSVGVYFILRNSLQLALNLRYIFTDLPIVIRPVSALILGAMGVVIVELASTGTFFYIRKLSSQELLRIIGKDKMDVVYDEANLFTADGQKEEELLQNMPFYTSNTQNSKIKPNSLARTKRKAFHLVKTSLYKDPLHVDEKRRKKSGWIFLLIGLLPIGVYIFYKYGSDLAVSDNLLSIIGRIPGIIENFIFLIVIAPIIFVVGIIRIIAYEKPSRLARIAKKLSKFVLKSNSKICAINIVRRKDYKKIMLVFSIFLTIFSIANISLHSLVIYQKIYENMKIGGDIYLDAPQIQFQSNAMGDSGLVNNYGINSNYDVNILAGNVENLNLGTQLPIVHNVVTVFKEITNNYHLTVFYLNFSKYLNVITEGGKYLPDSQIVPVLQSALDGQALNSSAPPIITNSRFLELYNIKPGDFYSFEHRFWNNSDLQFDTTYLNATIVGDLDMLPGLFGFNSEIYEWEEAVLIYNLDYLQNQNSTEVLTSFKFFQLADISPFMMSNSALTSFINRHISITQFDEISYYNQEWREFDYNYSEKYTSFLSILSAEFMVMGILTAIGVAILFLTTFKEDKEYNGVLLARGFGKMGVYRFALVEFAIIFLLSIFAALLTAMVFIKPVLGLGNIALRVYPVSWKIPLFFDFKEFLVSILLVPLVSIYIFSFFFSFSTRKTISEFFHQF